LQLRPLDIAWVDELLERPAQQPIFSEILQTQRQRLSSEPSWLPWLPRGMLRGEQLVGYAGFHGPPGADYLRSIAPGGVELVYGVFEAFRRCGFAFEACTALCDWAHQEHGVRQFAAWIDTDNQPSLALAHKLGFVDVGSHRTADGVLQDVLVLDWETTVRRGMAPSGAHGP